MLSLFYLRFNYKITGIF